MLRCMAARPRVSVVGGLVRGLPLLLLLEEEESVGEKSPVASRGWPFEWVVCGSQGLRCVGGG